MRSQPFTKILRGSWLKPDEFPHFFFGKQVKPSVNGFVSYSDFRNIIQRFRSAFYENRITFDQISVDFYYYTLSSVIPYPFFVCILRFAEPHDNAMNVRFDTGFTIPSERAICKIDMNTFVK